MRTVLTLCLAALVATFPNWLVTLLAYDDLTRESDSTRIPALELALIDHFQLTPWPVHGLNRIKSLRGRSEASENVVVPMILRTMFLTLGATSAILVLSRKSPTDSPLPESLSNAICLPGGMYVVSLAALHTALIVACFHYHQATGTLLYAAPAFLPLYSSWVITVVLFSGICLYLLGLSNTIF